MEKKLILGLIIILFLSSHVYAQSWEHISTTMGENSIHHISVDELNPLKLFAASERHLYVTDNGGKTWEKIFQTIGEKSKIHFIYSEPLYTKNIYIGTSTTLHTSIDNGHTWKKLYALPENKENVILSFTVNPFNPQELTLGTCKGLYISLHGGVSWKKMKGTLKNAHIIYAAYHPNIKGLLYVITDRGIYTINRSTDSISKTYTFISHKEDAQEYTQNNNCIEFFPSHDDLLLATYAGTIYRSNDRGNTWSLLSHNFGRKNKLINISPALVADIIFIALKDHIVTYNLKTKSIKTISEGLYAAYIYDLVLHNNKESILFSATDKGIFTIHFNPPKIEQNIPFIEIKPYVLEQLSMDFQKEPSIRDIQKKAIWYANVSNNKIKRWHRNARLRAFMPTLSIDFEKTIEDNIDLDRGSTSIKDVFITGPQEEDLTWEVSFEWELANLIWNPNQTTIDYREKYMIEMRDDILHEVTNLYYERRRLQLELHLTPPREPKKYLAQCLKIDELTAQIDALTGGYFTARLQDK